MGTCWLGGFFTRSTFSRKISAAKDEIIPAVCAVGPIAPRSTPLDDAIRQGVGARNRLSWDKLFFDRSIGVPLTQEKAGAYANALEMVRLGPSASNKQPWRIVKDGGGWHFYVQRTPGYLSGWLVKRAGIADLQRVDLGIAMCHFALTAAEAGLQGRWEAREPALARPDALTEYVVSWVSQGD
jgi:hypothetical protein